MANEDQADTLYMEDMVKKTGRTAAAIRQGVYRDAPWLPPAFKMGKFLAWDRVEAEQFFTTIKAKGARLEQNT